VSEAVIARRPQADEAIERGKRVRPLIEIASARDGCLAMTGYCHCERSEAI